MFWGPSGAGKDFLIRGFILETARLNNDVEENNLYTYDILEYAGQKLPAIQITELPTLTSSAESLILEFKRECRKRVEKRNSYQFTHLHHVVIHNNRGGELMEVPTGGSEDATITSAFKSANNIVVVLDKPTVEDINTNQSKHENDLEALISSTPPDDDSHSSYHDVRNGNNPKILTYNRVYYNRNLQLFFNYLEETKDKKNIAICMTKADQHNLEGDPKTVFSQLFGKESLTLIKNYEMKHSIKFFLTTTEGFRNHNANPANPTFKNPTNTASPFFWFFEEAEKARLRKNCPRFLAEGRQKNFVPYPAPES